MKNFFKIFISIIFLGVVAYQFRSSIDFSFLSQAPCKEPIAYTLGIFDKKFGISEKYFLDAVVDAEAIWEKPYDQELFQYVPEGNPRDLKINLIYDYRQETTRQLSHIGTALEANQESYDALRAEFESMRRLYEKDRSLLAAAARAFDKKQSAYEEEVKYWNARGGAPEGEYRQLQKERHELEAQAMSLEQKQEELNKSANEVNELVADLNALAKKLNLSVERYNTASGSRGETFEEGLYVQDGGYREINIYEFADRAELVRLLTHELGHALSMDHVADPEAIMYELNQSENLTPTEADLAELNQKCGLAETDGD